MCLALLWAIFANLRWNCQWFPQGTCSLLALWWEQIPGKCGKKKQIYFHYSKDLHKMIYLDGNEFFRRNYHSLTHPTADTPQISSPLPVWIAEDPSYAEEFSLGHHSVLFFNLLMLCKLLPVRFCLLLTIRQLLGRSGVSLCSVSSKFGTAS